MNRIGKSIPPLPIFEQPLDSGIGSEIVFVFHPLILAPSRHGERFGLKNAQFDVAFADHLPFPADAFNAVISRFGVMFFPSPVDACLCLLMVFISLDGEAIGKDASTASRLRRGHSSWALRLLSATSP